MHVDDSVEVIHPEGTLVGETELTSSADVTVRYAPPTAPPTTPPTTPEEPIIIEDPLTSLVEEVKYPVEEEELELEDVLADLPATGVLSAPVSVRWTLGALAILASMGIILVSGRKKEEQQ